MEELRYKPRGLWIMGDAVGISADRSGYSGNALILSAARGIPLTPAATASSKLGGPSTAFFAAPVYIAGRESESFSLSAVVYSVIGATNSSTEIVSKANENDGLTVDGTTYSFSTKYLTTGEAKCSYTLPVNKKVSVVGVHTKTKNTLYVDGDIVAEVDITSEQQADSYKSSTTGLRAGGSISGSDLILLNNVSVYTYALNSEQVGVIHKAANTRAGGAVPRMFGGEEVFFSAEAKGPFINEVWDTAEDWNGGVFMDSAAVDGDQLVAGMENGVTVLSQWVKTIDLYDGITPSPINSINVSWIGTEAYGVASIDGGETYNFVVNGSNIDIPTGFDPTGKSLVVGFLLPPSIEEAYVDSVRIQGYLTATHTESNRVVTMTNPAIPKAEYQPAELNDDWGVTLASTAASISISPDTISEVPLAVRTVELWVKATTGGSLTTNLTGATTYVNGVSGGTIGNDWCVVHYVLAANHTGSINLSGAVSIGKLAVYDTALTAPQITTIINTYTGFQKDTFGGSGTIQMTEPAGSTVIYAHDWSISVS